ncbi:MAG: hypothetical protein JWN14_608, partial [Chthonomonadales bacterium]|nr:hypothetical protein [Chthonomonadales bacterium]
MKPFLSTLAMTGALLVALASSVHADTVFFFNQGDQDVAGPYSLGGLTITGSDTLA